MRYFLIAFLLIVAAAQAQLNPKSIEEMTAVINLGGTLSVSGSIERANLSLHIPQEGVENVAVTGAGSWEYVNDAYGNRLLLLKWNNPTGIISYNVRITVKNKAKHFTDLGDVGSDINYLKETETIAITDDIRKMAFPYERSWQRIAELTVAVNKLVDYDINLVGERKSSDWVLQNRRGVCVEHANLLAALLRASGIPTRYVVGYAFSTVDNKLIGHTWVEVLNSRGEWIPFDPTWLEGGYIDATHIKTANLLDDKQVDTLNYFGSGRIEWQRAEENIEIATRNLTRDRIDIIDYRLTNITRIETFPREFSQNEYGFVKTRIESSECSIVELTASSCIDGRDQKIFDIYDSERNIWLCNAQDVYWFFGIKNTEHSSYVCPVSVYDQVGSAESAQISISGRRSPKTIVLSGPDKVGVNERFTLSGEGLLYSPDFGIISNELSIDTPGKYKFYLYSDGALAQKEIDVVESAQFSVRTDAPQNTTLNSSFLVNVRVKNLAVAKPAVIKLYFDEKTSQQSYNFLADEEKIFVFNLTAKGAGIKKITAEVISDSLASYTTFIEVKELPKKESIVDKIFNSIADMINAVLNFFRGIFNLRN